MRLLRRNTTEFEYLALLDEMDDTNSDGEHTGEPRRVFDEPIVYRGNISSPSGKVNQTFYGTDTPYTHVLVMDNPKTDIRETGMIRWRGYEFDIVAVRPTLNALSVALRRRTKHSGVTGG